MTVVIPEGQKREREPFNPVKVSPSRMNSLVSCGVAFRLHYVDGVPPQRSGSAALFGNVWHKALEKWAINRTQSLVQLVREAWLSETAGTVVKDFLDVYAPLSIQAIKMEHHIRESWAAKGMESKAPRRTKDWKNSQVGKDISALTSAWWRRLEAGSYWKFNEYDPLPNLYDESLVLARRYTARFQHLPPAIHTEMAFSEEWQGFILNGFIDAVELQVDPDTGELKALLVIDYKTYAKPPAEYKDWRQLVTYDIAIRKLVERGAIILPVPLDSIDVLVGIDYARWTDKWQYPDGKPFPPRKFWRIGQADYDRLYTECQSYNAIVSQGRFLPAEKGRNPDYCDYPGQCCLRHCTAAGGESTPVEVTQ